MTQPWPGPNMQNCLNGAARELNVWIVCAQSVGSTIDLKAGGPSASSRSRRDGVSADGPGAAAGDSDLQMLARPVLRGDAWRLRRRATLQSALRPWIE
jgi:hypothetical protein